jgi:hypothetical protein
MLMFVHAMHICSILKVLCPCSVFKNLPCSHAWFWLLLCCVSLACSNIIFSVSLCLLSFKGIAFNWLFFYIPIVSQCMTNFSHFGFLTVFHIESLISWGVVEDAMLIIRGDEYVFWTWKCVSSGPKEGDDIQSNTIACWSIQRQEVSFNCPETREVGQQHIVNLWIFLVIWLVPVALQFPAPWFSTLQILAVNEENWSFSRSS